MENKMLLLTTFVFEKLGSNDARIACQGCRELVPFNSEDAGHIRGVIKFNGKLIPVVDLSAQFCNEPVNIDNRNCLLIICHKSVTTREKLYSTVLLDNFDDVLKLSCNKKLITDTSELSRNARFLAEMSEDIHAEKLLEDNHIILRDSLCENEEEIVLA